MEMASIVNQYYTDYLNKYGQQALPSHLKTLNAIQRCRTAGSGELYVKCSECDHAEWRPLSCGNRHCHKCQNHAASQWIDKQQMKLLPVPYFMVTFTLPRELRSLVYHHQKTTYTLFFNCVVSTLKSFGLNSKQLGAEIGATMVLHTNSRKLNFHPHIHAVVPGGGIDKHSRLWKRVKSEENRKELSRACGKYLLATRMASVSEIKKKVLSKRGRYQVIRENLHAKEVVVGDGERRRRYVLCYNPKEAKRQLLHREMVVEQLEKTLASHSDKKATAQWAIELLASKRYKRYLKITATNKIRIDRAAIREAQRYDGKWVLETNDDTITVEDAAKGYKGLMIIERCFRSLKRTQIRMTPMFHWASRRVETHVKICVLSLLIERVAELACSKPWSQVRRALEKLQASEFENSSHTFFKLNEVDGEVREVLETLEVPVPASILSISPLKRQG